MFKSKILKNRSNIIMRKVCSMIPINFFSNRTYGLKIPIFNVFQYMYHLFPLDIN